MGKKSLTKSTAKKKSSSSKKSDSQKKQVNAVEVKPDANSKQTKKSAVKKSEATQKPTIQSLIQKDFGVWSPEATYTVQSDEAFLKNFTAPPVIDTEDETAAQRIRTLLSKQFDLTAMAEPETAAIEEKPQEKPQAVQVAEVTAAPVVEEPEIQTEKKPPVPIADLLMMKFDSWQPQALFSVSPDENYLKAFRAPESVESSDPNHADRLKSLLLKTIDLTVIDLQEALAPEIAEPKAEEKPAELQKPAVAPISAVEPAPEKAPAEPPKVIVEPPKESSPAKQEEIKEPASVKSPEKPPAPPVQKAKETSKEKPVQDAPVESVAPVPKSPVDLKKAQALLAGIGAKTIETLGPGLTLLVGCIAAMFAVLFISSSIHTGKYYIKQAGDGIEVWKGKFAPTGKELVLSIPDGKLPKQVKPVYSKAEAMIPVFDYYIRQADQLSEIKGTPDFEAIKANLNKAMEFAPSRKEYQTAANRLNSVDFRFFLYQADIAARDKSPQNIVKALNLLTIAKSLEINKSQQEVLDRKINHLQAVKNAMEKQPKQPAKPAASDKEQAPKVHEPSK